MIQRIGNVCVVVADVRRSVEFYSQVLELDGEIWSQHEGIVHVGDIYLYLVRSQTDESRSVGRTINFASNPIGIDHLSFEVGDIERASTQLQARGVRFPGPIVTEPDGFRYRGFSDPDGNMLYLIQSPPGPPSARELPPWLST